MMKKICFALSALMISSTSLAHFGVLLPDQAVVMDQKKMTVNLTASFNHPMEQNGMTMVKPKAFGVVVDEKKQDLLSQMKPTNVLGKEAWKTQFQVKRPGVYQFYLEPAPYWEGAEDKFIIHHTKVVVPAFVDDESWTQPIGLKTEIVPLTRPFGNYEGNLFQGKVLLNGKPAVGVPVEVEYYNDKNKLTAPTDLHVTQIVMTDEQGVFSYNIPWNGWWGFAALTDADFKLKHKGQDRDVELGAVLWSYFSPIPSPNLSK